MPVTCKSGLAGAGRPEGGQRRLQRLRWPLALPRPWALAWRLLVLSIALSTALLPIAARAALPVTDLAVLVDAAGVETIDSVSAPAAWGRFKPLRGDFRAGYTHDVHWLRFTVQAPVPGPWWLAVQPAVLDDLRLFEPAAAGFVEHRGGDTLPFAGRDLDYRGFVFKLDLTETAPRSFYLRIQTQSSSQARLALWHPADFAVADSLDAAGLGFYFGLAGLLLSLNLVLWVTLRESLFGWFSLHVAAHMTVYFGIYGLASQFLLPDTPWLGDFWSVVGMACYVASAAPFYRRMLVIRGDTRWRLLPFRVQALLPWLMLPAYFSGHYPEVTRLVVAVSTLFVPWLLLLSLRLWRQGQPEARWIVLANAVTLGGSGLQAMGLLGWTPDPPLSYNTHLYTSLGALLAMQLALATRIGASRGRRVQAERQAAEAARSAAVERHHRAGLQALLSEKTALLADLQQAQRLGAIGSWEWVIASDTVAGSEVYHQLIERDPQSALLRRSDFTRCYAAPSRQRLQAAITTTLATGEPYVVELELALPSGRPRWVESRGAALRNPQGAIVKLAGTLQDITGRRAVQQADAARQAAEMSARQQDAFLARVSHELRTPLNAVLGFTQLLALDDQVRGSPVAAEQVGMILGAAGHLQAMIDDVLDLARIQSGSLPLALESSDARALAAECLAWMAPMAASRQVTLSLQGQPGAQPVLADHRRLRQVLINLLSNAIKYNRVGGSVRLSLLPVADPALPACIDIVVTDTGPGLTKQQIESLFQPFNRLGAESGSIEGTGLGLAVVRELVVAMGGSIRVSSAPAAGAVFTVRLPAAASGAASDPAQDTVTPGTAEPTCEPAADLPAPPTSKSAAPASGPEAAAEPLFVVLYVEDNRLNATVMRHALKRLPGVRLEIAADGDSGLERARQLRPDLMLLDMNLPGLSGTELLQRLRAEPALAAIPCVAVSANVMGVDIERALAAGFDDYVTKPFSIEHLLGLVQGFRQRETTRGGA